MATTTVNVVGPWAVPASITYITIKCAGAAGAASDGSTAGKGGVVEGTISVNPGDVIAVVLGKMGSGAAGGTPDGRDGFRSTGGPGPGSFDGSGGGGGTTVRRNGTIVCVAGGGGGGPFFFGASPWPAGGDGGYPAGDDVLDRYSPFPVSAYGGTQVADGADTTYGYGVPGGGGGGGYHRGGNGFDVSGPGAGAGAGGSGWYSITVESPVTAGLNPGAGYVQVTYNAIVPPTIPTIIAPKAGAVLPSTDADIEFQWAHNGDSAQLSFDLWIRPVGGAWAGHTTGGSPPESYSLAMLAVGAWEYQIRTSSQNGLASPWTAVTGFTVAAPPDPPAVTAPAPAGTITARHALVSWTAPAGQQAARVTITSGGVPWDSGEQGGGGASINAPFTVEGPASVTVAVKVAGLWSASTTVSVTVAWVLPTTPVLTVRANDADGSIDASWTQPAGSPAVDHYDVWAVEAGVLTQLLAGSTDMRVTYWTPAADATVTIRVTAVSVGDTAVTVEGQ